MPSSNLSAPMPHVDAVVQFSDNDKPLFNELRDVLKKHNSLERFGITLLHSHFPVANDEVLLETTDVASRRQTIEPIHADRLKEMTIMETAWRMDEKNIYAIGRCQVETTSVPPQHVDRP